MTLKKLSIAWTVIVLVALVVGLVGCAKAPAPPPATPAPAPTTAPAPAPKPVLLKGVHFVAANSASNRFGFEWSDRVNQRSNGQLTIKWAGGPEVIAANDLAAAVRKGVIDIALIPGDYYRDLVPQVVGMVISVYTPLQERQNGYYDFLNEAHKKVNMFYLGRVATNQMFNVFTRKKVERPQDFAGQQLRTGASYITLIKRLGASPVSMSHSDTYSALERGVIDGTLGPLDNVVSLKQYEVLKYWINHPFYTAAGTILIMNPDSWKGLPKHLQDLIMDTQKQCEGEMGAWFGVQDAENLKKLEAAGLKPITFSPEDAKSFLNTANEAQLEEMKKVMSPEDYGKAVRLLLK